MLYSHTDIDFLKLPKIYIYAYNTTESRLFVHVVHCEKQLWIVYDLHTKYLALLLLVVKKKKKTKEKLRKIKKHFYTYYYS